MDPPRKTFDSTFGYFSIRLCKRNVMVSNLSIQTYLRFGVNFCQESIFKFLDQTQRRKTLKFNLHLFIPFIFDSKIWLPSLDEIYFSKLCKTSSASSKKRMFPTHRVVFWRRYRECVNYVGKVSFCLIFSFPTPFHWYCILINLSPFPPFLTVWLKFKGNYVNLP